MAKFLRIIATLIFASAISAMNKRDHKPVYSRGNEKEETSWQRIGCYSLIAGVVCGVVTAAICSNCKVVYPDTVLDGMELRPLKFYPIETSLEAAKDIIKAMEAVPNHEQIKECIDSIGTITQVLEGLTSQACDMVDGEDKVAAGKQAMDVYFTLCEQVRNLTEITNNQELVPILSLSKYEAIKRARSVLSDSKSYLGWLGDYSGEAMDPKSITLDLLKSTLSGGDGSIAPSHFQKAFKNLNDPSN